MLKQEEPTSGIESNWSGSFTFSAARLHRPTSVEQVQDLVARAHKVKAIGARHSFSAIANSSEDLVSLEHLNKMLAIDRERGTVTVEGGIRYGALCRQLHNEGFALHNMASLPHITVAGACATATHGSGARHGNLSTAVSAMEIVTADGKIVVLSRDQDGEGFRGAVVGLGGLGVVTKLTLDISPAFQMRQDVYENLPVAQLETHFDEIMSTGYSVSFFTDWQGANIAQIWVKSCATDDFELRPTLFDAAIASSPRHPIIGGPVVNCTEQMGLPGPWYERLPHFRLEYTPSSGSELQSEYFVPREHAFAAMSAITDLRDQVTPLLRISEIRAIAADELWMSPCYRRASVALHFTWKKDWPGVSQLLPRIEQKLAPFDARPHWGKLFTMPPARLHSLYERLPDFQELLRRFDPAGKFRNAFLDQLFSSENHSFQPFRYL